MEHLEPAHHVQMVAILIQVLVMYAQQPINVLDVPMQMIVKLAKLIIL
jgi:hypothetical protein